MPLRPLQNDAAHLADRFIEALASLNRAVAQTALAGGTPTLSEGQATHLFLRLSALIRALIRTLNFGVRCSAAKPDTPEVIPEPTPRSTPELDAPRTLGYALPRRPGWLLAALPDLAPEIAGEIRAALADPAIAALFDQAPALLREFRSTLRSLGLTLPDTVAPPPSPKPTTQTELAPQPPPSANQDGLPQAPAEKIAA